MYKAYELIINKVDQPTVTANGNLLMR